MINNKSLMNDKLNLYLKVTHTHNYKIQQQQQNCDFHCDYMACSFSSHSCRVQLIGVDVSTSFMTSK